MGAGLLFALIAGACNGGGGGEGDDPATANALPDIVLASFDGSPSTTLNDYVGKPLVVNFWAEWCPSCVAEMSRAFKPAQEQLGDEVTFLGVNIQDKREKAVELLRQTGVGWVSVENQDGSLYTELGGIGAMPFTVFISADGEIVDRHSGPLNERLLTERIHELLLG